MEPNEIIDFKKKLKSDPKLFKCFKDLKEKYDKELKTAQDRIKTLEDSIKPLSEVVADQRNELKSLRKQLEETKEGLKPLANLMISNIQKYSDDHILWSIAPGRGDPRPINMKHIRDARRLINLPLEIPMIVEKYFVNTGKKGKNAKKISKSRMDKNSKKEKNIEENSNSTQKTKETKRLQKPTKN